MATPRATLLMNRTHVLFPSIFNAATAARSRNMEDISLSNFLKAFTSELKKLRVAFDILPPERNLLLIEHTFLTLVIAPEGDPDTAMIQLRERMHQEGIVLIGFIIQVNTKLLWRRVQISEKWLKA